MHSKLLKIFYIGIMVSGTSFLFAGPDVRKLLGLSMSWVHVIELLRLMHKHDCFEFTMVNCILSLLYYEKIIVVVEKPTQHFQC